MGTFAGRDCFGAIFLEGNKLLIKTKNANTLGPSNCISQHAFSPHPQENPYQASHCSPVCNCKKLQPKRCSSVKGLSNTLVFS